MENSVMANLTITESLFERLRDLAQRHNRRVEEIAAELLEQSLLQAESTTPTPSVSETAYEAALREIRPKIYAKARRYWQETGNAERLALTDSELDEQFWLIDPDGIPRLKSEQGTIELPPDPLLIIAEAAEEAGLRSEQGDISARSRELLETDYPGYLMRRMRGQDNDEK
jgi:hypothetical protein